MTEAVETCSSCGTFLDHLKTLAWCKQGENLVAVHKCTAEVIEVLMLGDHELSIHPGGMKVKMQKSWISTLMDKNNEGMPIPVLLVWKPEAVEIWYRRHNSNDFPYDTWSNPAAAAYERELVRLPASHGGDAFRQYRQELLDSVKVCPSAIPPQ